MRPWTTDLKTGGRRREMGDKRRVIYHLSNGKGGQIGAKAKKIGFFGLAAVANVTNVRFKSSTVPMQIIILACKPSERKSRDTATV